MIHVRPEYLSGPGACPSLERNLGQFYFCSHSLFVRRSPWIVLPRQSGGCVVVMYISSLLPPRKPNGHSVNLMILKRIGFRCEELDMYVAGECIWCPR